MARRPSLSGLPEEIHEKILTELSDMSLKDAWRAKAVCKGFNEIQGSTSFLKGVSMLNNGLGSHIWHDGIIEYMEACLAAGNLEAKLLAGVTWFMYDDFNEPDVGLVYIKTAALEGNIYARYVYEIIRKRLWPLEMNATDIGELSRGEARKIRSNLVGMTPLPHQVHDLGVKAPTSRNH